MDLNEALLKIKDHLTGERYDHTVRVVETAQLLASHYGVNVKMAEIAAVFHDYAKFRPEKEMRTIIIERQMPDDLLKYDKELWHAPVGAYLVEKEVGITNEEILQAIKYHTTGHPNMTLLDKIIFIADYIEPGRTFPGLDDVRNLAYKDLDEALLLALKKTISYLLHKNRPIYPDTFKTYNDLIFKKEELLNG